MLNRQQLIDQFIELLGSDKVLASVDQLKPYKNNTIGFDESYYDEYIVGVLKPDTTDQVVSIVEIANIHNVPLYPISTGRNWGYGSKAPTALGSFIIDLSNMKKIREVNNEIGYAIIEPGVTQEDLTIFLKENCPEFILDKTGAPVATSIIGNTLERGWGLRGCKDKVVNGFEIVSGSGKTFRTGSWGAAIGEPFYRYTPGPITDQLFCQSNFGIITAMALKLYPRPEQFNALFCTIPREKLLITIKEIQLIKRHDQEIFFKVLLDKQYITNNNAPFTVFIFMYGIKDILKLKTKKTMEVFNKLGTVNLKEDFQNIQDGTKTEDIVSLFVHPDSTRGADVSNYMFRDFDEFSMPNHENLDEVDDFGLHFYDCIIPNNSKLVQETLEYFVNTINKKYKLSTRITLHIYDHDTIVIVNYIVFNRKDKNAARLAKQCVDEFYANQNLVKIRLTPWHMNCSYEGKEFLDGIKNVFDPKRIIAPRRYE